MNIKELMSERAQSNKKFDSVVLEPTQEELENLQRFINAFPNLITIDFAPEQFMQALSDLLGYTYLETEDSEVQREILKRLVKLYHNKGLVSELKKIANRGYSDNYFLGDLTYYNGPLEDGYSSITFPRDNLFQYDYSRWDGPCHWPDDREWRDGVVKIDISVPTDPTGKIIDLIDANLAAGLKYYISILRDIAMDGDVIYLAYKVLDDIHDILIYDDIGVLENYGKSEDFFRWDYSKFDNARWESHLRISHDVWEEKKPQAGIHRIFYPIDFGYTVAEVWNEPFIWNWNRYCGVIGGYEESDLYEINLGIVDFSWYTATEEQTVEVQQDEVRPFAKLKEDVHLDFVALDNAKWDSHRVVLIEVIEETKPKVRFRLDRNQWDFTAYDGDHTDEPFVIEEKQIGPVGMINTAFTDLYDELDNITGLKDYIQLMYFSFDNSQYDQAQLDRFVERVSVEVRKYSLIERDPRDMKHDKNTWDNSIIDGVPMEDILEAINIFLPEVVFEMSSSNEEELYSEGNKVRVTDATALATRFDEVAFDNAVTGKPYDSYSSTEILQRGLIVLPVQWDDTNLDDKLLDGDIT